MVGGLPSRTNQSKPLTKPSLSTALPGGSFTKDLLGDMCAHALLAMPCRLTKSAESMRFKNFAIDSLERLDDNEV